MHGQVIKLDRGYPLVRTDEGIMHRTEHAMTIVKGERQRAVIGDNVMLEIPEGHDKAIITEILPRTTQFIRKDPTERATSQVLAANFDQVIVAQPLADVNFRRLERELVLAHETGAQIIVALTKADLADEGEDTEKTLEIVQSLAGNDEVIVISAEDGQGTEELRATIAPNTVSILIGKSGVGKSSLVNMLVGEEVQRTTEVRDVDGKGRHTTVSREMIKVPGGGYVVDMPGVRGLGLWDAEQGIEAAFPDIETTALNCKFRDCKHGAEPGCAVREAVSTGKLSAFRLESYRALRQETDQIRERREEADRMRTRKGHPRKRH